MRIATVTLNPAIDQTVRVNNFRPNAVNRAQSMQSEASGKGVNVASFLVDYGHAISVTGFLGQDNSALFEQFFAARHIDDHFIRLPGHTRTNVKLVDEVRQQTTDINMPGLTPSPEALDALPEIIAQLATSCDCFALCGSLPPGTPTTIYATLIAQLKQRGKTIILDTSGEALRMGVEASPTIIKPNVEELQQLTGQSLTSEAAIQQAARQLLNADVRMVAVSMGERGALLVEAGATVLATPPAITIKKTFGAGDAMVAGLIAARLQHLSLADSARLASAFSLAAITRLDYHLPDRATLQAYFQQVDINER
ncbi:MAG: 1-phosphofructokinase [Ktedonobacteraceae bacterium]